MPLVESYHAPRDTRPPTSLEPSFTRGCARRTRVAPAQRLGKLDSFCAGGEQTCSAIWTCMAEPSRTGSPSLSTARSASCGSPQPFRHRAGGCGRSGSCRLVSSTAVNRAIVSAHAPWNPVRYWLPPFLWASLIFILSSLHTIPTPSVPGVSMDKVAHATVYAILAGLCFRAFATGEQFPARWAALLSALFATAYGATDEIHQSFVAGRACEGGDLVADAAGAIVAAAFCAWWRARRAR